MKRILFITTALVALAMLASCQKSKITESPTMDVTRFTATILQAKTTIASNGKITWNEGDTITVTDNATPANSAVYVAQSSGTSTTFSLKPGEKAVTTAPYTATYGDLTNQIYSATGANCPLSAQSSTTDFTFSSPYAILKITATSEADRVINNVTVENAPENSDTTTLAILNCEGAVNLSFPKTTVFYVAVEPGTYDRLKITFNATSDWKAAKGRTGAVTLAAGDLLPLTLYFISDDWSCVAAGTMITLWNGSQKAVEELEINDLIRTVDHETGAVSSAPVCFVWKTENAANAFTLTFGNDTDVTEVTVVQEHGFYSREKRKYVFINADNAKDYFGCHFYDADNGRWLELKACKLLDKRVDAYSVVTSRHLDHLSNGMLSMCDGEEKVLANIFEYDDTLKFDVARKAADIEKYGLTPIEKVLEYKGFSESFYYDYNLMYLNVAIGKGLTSWDFIKALSDYYESFQ